MFTAKMTLLETVIVAASASCTTRPAVIVDLSWSPAEVIASCYCQLFTGVKAVWPFRVQASVFARLFDSIILHAITVSGKH